MFYANIWHSISNSREIFNVEDKDNTKYHWFSLTFDLHDVNIVCLCVAHNKRIHYYNQILFHNANILDSSCYFYEVKL